MYYARQSHIIQFLFPIHDTADTQRHSGNNLYTYSFQKRIGNVLFNDAPNTFYLWLY